MDQICLVVPITPGKTADARDFMRELEEQRKPDYDRSERRIGITKEAWYLAHTPGGDQFVAFMETPDSARPCACSPSRMMSSTCGSSAAWPTPPALTSTPRPPGRCPNSYRAIPHRRSPRQRQATKVSAGIWVGTAIPRGIRAGQQLAGDTTANFADLHPSAGCPAPPIVRGAGHRAAGRAGSKIEGASEAAPLAAEPGEAGAGLTYRVQRSLAVPADGGPHKTDNLSGGGTSACNSPRSRRGGVAGRAGRQCGQAA